MCKNFEIGKKLKKEKYMKKWLFWISVKIMKKKKIKSKKLKKMKQKSIF